MNSRRAHCDAAHDFALFALLPLATEFLPVIPRPPRPPGRISVVRAYEGLTSYSGVVEEERESC